MKEYRKPLSIVVSKYEREFTESGKALIKLITSKTDYTIPPRYPEPNGTLRFGNLKQRAITPHIGLR